MIYRCKSRTIIKSVNTSKLYELNKGEFVTFKTFSRDKAIIKIDSVAYTIDKVIFSERFEIA